jgi:hypothetical protein
MPDETEITTLLSKIRAERNLNDFIVAPSSKGKKKEVQKEIPQTDMPSPPSVLEAVDTEMPNNKSTVFKNRDNKIPHSGFLTKIQHAENTFSFKQKRRFYLDDRLYQTLSLLKLSSDIPNVSTFVNILITHILEENHTDIEAILKSFSKR